MFYQVRFQTGEIEEIVSQMKAGKIPCMDVTDMDEYNWVVEKLSSFGIQRASDIPLDKAARDRIKEPEFEFRAAFTSSDNVLRYIDFYFEPFIEKEYDSAYGD